MDIERTMREDWEETREDVHDGVDAAARRAKELGSDLRDSISDGESRVEEEWDRL